MTQLIAREVRAIVSTPSPGRADLKQARAVKTQTEILRRAAEAFAAKGFPAVTMMDIAALAGLTKGAVYFHYVNKEALALAVSQEFYSRLRSIAAASANRPTPMAALTAFLIELAVAFQQEQVMQAGARLQIERAMIDTTLPEPYRDATAAIGGWLEEAATADERMRTTDPAALARVLIAAIFGAQHISWVVSGREDILERMLEIIATLLPHCAAETEAAITALPASSRRRVRRAQQRIRSAGQSPSRA